LKLAAKKLVLRTQFPVLLLYATYLSLASQPGVVFASYSDKFLHVLCWCVLLLSLRLAMAPKFYRYRSALGLFLYAAGVEYLQNLSPERYFSWLDMLANGVGIVLGIILWGLYWRLLQRFSARKIPSE